MNPLGKFVNMTAKFYPTSIIDLNKDRSEKAQSNMILQRNGSTPISPGNYTIGISATDGTVTKSVLMIWLSRDINVSNKKITSRLEITFVPMRSSTKK